MPPSSSINGDNDADVTPRGPGGSYYHGGSSTRSDGDNEKDDFTNRNAIHIESSSGNSTTRNKDPATPSPTRLAKNRYLRAVHYANVHNSRYASAAAANTTSTTPPPAAVDSRLSSGENSQPQPQQQQQQQTPGNPPPPPGPVILPITKSRHVPTTRPLKPPSYADRPESGPPVLVPRKYMIPKRISSPIPTTTSAAAAAAAVVTPPPANNNNNNNNNNVSFVSSSSETSVGSLSETATAASTNNNNVRSSSRNVVVEPPPQPHALAKSSSEAMEWRKHGKVFRAKLVLEDEDKGGNAFTLSQDCGIERYYKVAERVLEQFLSTSIRRHSQDADAELAESYLVGNRLVKFLSMVLPTHPEYFSNDPTLYNLRKRSQSQLVELLQYLEEIARVVDELQYNKYLVRDLSPEEETLVRELTMGGGGKKTATTATVGKSTTMNPPPPPPQQVTPTKRQQRRETSAARDSTRTTSDDMGTTSSSTSSASAAAAADALHQRVAQVVRVTEAFSDTYEQHQASSEGGGSGNGVTTTPNTAHLKQTLLAAAASAQILTHSHHHHHRRSNSAQLSTLRSDYPDPELPVMMPPPPQVNRSKYTTAAAAGSSHRDNNNIHRNAESSSSKPSGDQSLDESFWESDSFDDWDFHDQKEQSSTPGAPQSHIDLLEEASNCGPAPNYHNTSNNRGQSPTIVSPGHASMTAATTSTTTPPIPKLKQPPTRPSRAAMARAAAALQFDDMYMQSQMGGKRLHPLQQQQYPQQQQLQQQQQQQLQQQQLQQQQMEENRLLAGEQPRSDADLMVPLPPPSGSGAPEELKTKIEERWARAAAVKRELESMDPNQVDGGTTTTSISPRREEVNPTNPFNDDFDENSIAEEAESRQLTSNRNILRHFKGCVQCLLD